MNTSPKRALNNSREEIPSVPTSKTDNTILTGYPPVGTLKDAASILQIGMTTARQYCREGRLPAFKVGQQWRISRAALEAYILKGGGDCE